MTSENTKFEEFELTLKWFSGYITEPKTNYTEQGLCHTKFAVQLKKNKQDETTFLNCVLWNKKAEEFAEKYKKGDILTVGGIIITNEYKGKIYETLDVKIYN